MPAPNYTPPTRAEMKTIVARTLRDEDHSVFPGEMLNDFIDEGISDLNGYRPIEAMEVLPYAPDLDLGKPDVFVQPAILSYVYQLEVRNEAGGYDPQQSLSIPYNEPESSPLRNGWDYFTGQIRLGRTGWWQLYNWAKAINGELEFVLFGYRDRDLPATDADILDLEDTTDYLCLVKHCRMLGFQMLNNDRALYQQWLAATNNTDASPTQLQGMLGQAQSEVERQRKRHLVLRRTVIHGPQYY